MTYQLQVIVPYFTGLPTDVVVNDFSFDFPNGTPDLSDWTALEGHIKLFYDTVYNNTTNALNWAPWMNRALARVRAYNRLDPIPRVPVYESPIVLAGTSLSTSDTPLEQAICLSFQGAKVSGQSQARRRGRIYLGGIGGGVTAGNATTFPQVSPATGAHIGTAAGQLLNSTPLDGWVWGVWSRADNAFVDISDGWVDNAIDTQRRRGNATTTRSLWT